MAPATTKARDTNFTDIGVAGRKTGITVKDTGQRDDLGMELMDGFFSPDVSPEKEPLPKSSPAKFDSNGGTISIDESMDIVTSEQPARLPSRASLPPRARSPIKTTLNSPARRASSVGLSSPVRQQAPINRKLTFGQSGGLESSPALPPPLPAIGRSPSVDPPASSRNGTSTLSSQQKKKQPLEQVAEEPSSPVVKKAPAKTVKTAKRGLLVSKKPSETKKAFSLTEGLDSDSGSDSEVEVHESGKSGVEDGVSTVLDDDLEDTVMTEVQEDGPDEEAASAMEAEEADEAEEAEEAAAAAAAEEVVDDETEEEEAPVNKAKAALKPKLKPLPKKAKATEKDTTTKSNSKAKGKKAAEPEPEPESESESEPEQEQEPTPAKPTRGKKAQLTKEPEVESEPTPAKATRGKKATAKVLELETESEPTPPTKRARGKKAPPKVSEIETESEPISKAPKGRGKKAAKPIEELLEEEEAPRDPSPKPTTKGRGKKTAKPIEELLEEEEEAPCDPPPKPTTKGRSKGRAKATETLEPEQESVEDQEEPPKKRTKTIKEKSSTKTKEKAAAPVKPPKPKAESPELQSFTPKSNPNSKTSTSQKSPIVKKGTQRVIKEPPPPSRAPSEDPNGARRSSRAHIAPLAYWKGEKVIYKLGSRRKSSTTIALPSISEVIRVESDSEAERAKADKRRKRSGGTKRKRTKEEEEEEEDFEEEDWESRVVDGEIGVVRGYVKTFHDPPIEETPGEEELEERELAFSRNRIVTVEVANGDFTFVKTCTEDFFGTGMVEIPPGGIKRTKNSGKMHLVFYVISGKVEVKIGENEFRVRKGAQFMVPRGNLYSIENPYDFKAKMFFAQGCEKVIRAEDEDEDEEMESR